MRARKLIDGASFGPETVKAMGQAFDQAWAEIAENFWRQPNRDREREAEVRGSDAPWPPTGHRRGGAEGSRPAGHGDGLPFWHPTTHSNVLTLCPIGAPAERRTRLPLTSQ